jgi:hypothetical protein
VVNALLGGQGDGSGQLAKVSGKWRRLVIRSTSNSAASRHPLSAAFAPGLVLFERDCAALSLFDCPVVVARNDADLDVYLEASYEASFLALLASLGVAV